MAALRHSVVARAQLSAVDRGRMLALMQLCYDDVDAQRFSADLDNKHYVIVVHDSGGALCGFSTVRMTRELLDGRPVQMMFSGDTVLHPDHWGSKIMQRGFVRFVLRAKMRAPTLPLYWLLLSKGYRTYLLLANNFPTALPRHDQSPPPALVELRDRVAFAWWGSQYDASAQVLRYQGAHDRVKQGVAPIDAQLMAHPDIGFFARMNPHHARGDELVCLALIDVWLPARFFVKQLRRWLAWRGAQSRGVQA